MIVLEFFQTDTRDHGFEIADGDMVRKCDESEAQKPDAILVEIPSCGPGESEVDEEQDGLSGGESPRLFLKLEVVKESANPVDFACVVHGNPMSGSITVN